jgi:hypothetical protein
MELDSFIQAMSGDVVLAVRNATRFAHFIGLAIGLGAATMLDLMLLRFVARKRITHDDWQMIDFGARIVSVGLTLLWITGIAFIVEYAFFDPAKLMNEKIWAKLVIVGVLTANGMFIHSVVMPRIKAQIGQSLFAGMSRGERNAFLVSGAISATSWYVPVALGAFSQLNNTITAIGILAVYASMLVLMTVVMKMVMYVAGLGARKAPALAMAHPNYQIRLTYGA